MSTSSTTIVTSVGCACVWPPGTAIAAGTQSVRFSPTTMSCTPSAHPSEKPVTGRLAG